MSEQKVHEEEIFIEAKPKFKKKEIHILVISNNKHDYIRLFKDVKISELPVVVDQASWKEITLSAYKPSNEITHGLVVELANKTSEKLLPNSMQWKRRVIKPDFLLIRNVCRTVYPNDNRNTLFGFMYANIPSVNSLESIYFALERTNVHAELKKIQKRLGKNKFPLIDQHFHSTGRDINFPPECFPEKPIVAKVGAVHAGFGKSIVKDQDRLRDLRSIVSMHNQYTTTEPFIEAEYELRLQKIGDSYRAMKKELLSYWKSNAFGTAKIEDVKVTATHKLWLDECSKIYGGMDIFALDVLHTKEGKEYILELNGTSIGFGPDHVEEDLKAIKQVVIDRVKEKLLKTRSEDDYKIPTVKDLEIDKINLTNDVMQNEKDIRDLKIRNEILENKVKTLDMALEKAKQINKQIARINNGGFLGLGRIFAKSPGKKKKGKK